jgi:hypothetical protein
VEIGPGPVLLSAVAWLYWTGSSTAGTVLLVWTLLVSPVDNILRPILIKKGADLPLLLIIAGVIGGMLAFGIIGLFVGPVVLAVAYTLFTAWINQDGAISRTEKTVEKIVGKESSQPALFMTVRRETARKRVPREAYLASDDADILISSCASRTTLHAQAQWIGDCSRSVYE